MIQCLKTDQRRAYPPSGSAYTLLIAGPIDHTGQQSRDALGRTLSILAIETSLFDSVGESKIAQERTLIAQFFRLLRSQSTPKLCGKLGEAKGLEHQRD